MKSYIIDGFYRRACEDAREMAHLGRAQWTDETVIERANEARNRINKPGTFRKKPVVIEAYQTPVDIEVQTLEGRMKAPAGYWIIKGIKGEYYACEPEIFEATYEPETYPREMTR